MQLLTTLFAGLVTMLVLDSAWIYFVVGKLFDKMVGSSMRSPLARGPALLAWLAILLGIYLLVLKNPLVVDRRTAAIGGAVFGLVAYSIYDMTNLSTLKFWTWQFAVTDIVRGTILCTLTTVAMYFTASAWL